MTKTVYYLGNKKVAQDRAALAVIPYLKKKLPHCRFEHVDPTEDLKQTVHEDLIIIDTIVGLDQVEIFNDLDNFLSSPRFSPHDYDLFLELSLLKKLGKIKKFTIIGIPATSP